MASSIVLWPNKVLTTATRPVTEFGEPLEALLARMLASVVEAEGIGIAANQIGVALAVALVARPEEEGSFFEIINPEILSHSERVILEEGCLSVPGEWEKTPRFHKVKVRYQDKAGAFHELEAEGRLAHILQHEVGHLFGSVFVDLLSGLKRGLIRDRMLKMQRQQKQS